MQESDKMELLPNGVGAKSVDEETEHIRLVSLGNNCGPKLSFKHLGRGAETLPFDWIRTRMEAILHFIRSNFEGFFDFTTTASVPGIKGMIMYRNTLHSFWHDNPTDGGMRDRYLRRIARFNSIDAKSNPVLFVRVAASINELKRVEELLDLLAMQFGDESHLLLILNHQVAAKGAAVIQGMGNLLVYFLGPEAHIENELAPYCGPIGCTLDWMVGRPTSAMVFESVASVLQVSTEIQNGSGGLGGLAAFEDGTPDALTQATAPTVENWPALPQTSPRLSESTAAPPAASRESTGSAKRPATVGPLPVSSGAVATDSLPSRACAMPSADINVQVTGPPSTQSNMQQSQLSPQRSPSLPGACQSTSYTAQPKQTPPSPAAPIAAAATSLHSLQSLPTQPFMAAVSTSAPPFQAASAPSAPSGSKDPGVKVVSLGHHCGPRLSCRHLGWDSEALPFDWIRVSLSGVMHFLRTDIQDFFSYRVKQPVPRSNGMVVFRDHLHSFWYDDPTDPETRSCYARRFQRLHDIDASASPTLFVRVAESASELEQIRELLSQLVSMFGSQVCLLVIFDHQNTAEGPAVIEDTENLMLHFLGASGEKANSMTSYAAPIQAAVQWVLGEPVDAMVIPTLMQVAEVLDAYPTQSTASFWQLEGLPGFESVESSPMETSAGVLDNSQMIDNAVFAPAKPAPLPCVSRSPHIVAAPPVLAPPVRAPAPVSGAPASFFTMSMPARLQPEPAPCPKFAHIQSMPTRVLGPACQYARGQPRLR